MPRFKNQNMEESYQYALTHHDVMMSNRMAGHRDAYHNGFLLPRGSNRYSRNTLAYAYWAAGKENCRRGLKALTHTSAVPFNPAKESQP